MKLYNVICLVAAVLLPVFPLFAQSYYVSPAGNDSNPGTLARPFASLQRAQQAVRKQKRTVFLRGGTYYLPEPVVFTDRDSGTKDAPMVYQGYPNEQPVISGGVKLAGLKWRPYKNGIMQAQAPEELRTEEIFVNGQRQILARYPNYDPAAKYFDGYAADAISTNRAARWADPAGGYFHAMHPSLWGDFTWIITGKDTNNRVQMEGGWQNNRGGAINQRIRFVENIFEELDAPGEWFLNTKTHTLYFYPPAGLDLATATVEATCLRNLVEFRGDDRNPVRFVFLKGLTFRQAARTVMDTKEPLLRSDWAIYRGGAIFFNGAEDCSLEDCLLDQLGGNAVFVNNYNRRVLVRGCHIVKAGASGICFVGDPNAARSPLFNYERRHKLEEIDRTPGPRTDDYPSDCLVDDCLIHETGRVEKQTAPVEIDLSQNITIRHCSIYDVPRAGINIGDGCWGGHVIEFCDIFNTVKETGDHGSYNSWGRDRYWLPEMESVNAWVKQVPELPLLDAVQPIILRNNRWRCDHGWDIDLDDGSSNYRIYDNLCLNGGIKNREGYHRVVENNILVHAGFCPHCWFADSGDIFRRNIVWVGYQPARMYQPPWGREMDYNFVQVAGQTKVVPAIALQKSSGRDEHSLVGDALFVDPSAGDYRVRDDSPVLTLGFTNFLMDQFGVQKAELKAIARQPVLPDLLGVSALTLAHDTAPHVWLGARVRNITGAGEVSAFGLSDTAGALVLELAKDSLLAKSKLQNGDVILSINHAKILDVKDLLVKVPSLTSSRTLIINVFRSQREISLTMTP